MQEKASDTVSLKETQLNTSHPHKRNKYYKGGDNKRLK